MAVLSYKDPTTGAFIPLYSTIQGPAGNGIASIEQTSSSSDSGGSNVWTATMTNGTTATFTVKNGAQGAKGDKGDNYGDGVYLPLTGGTLSGTLAVHNAYIYIKHDNWPQLAFQTAAEKFRGLIYYGGGTSAIGNFTLRNYIDDTGTNYKEAYLGVDGGWYANTVHGAVWNDYAEFRQTKYPVKPGHVVYENGDDTLSESYKRMMPACSIVSDTFGFAIGETEKCKTPLAQAGRVLAYPLEDRNSYKPGDAVCSGPNGTVSKMTQDEKITHPECIIGYVSCVPDYETWGEKDTKVDGRIWIKVV